MQPPGQSGNFVSSFMNYANATGIGISRAVSAGNAAQVTVPEADMIAEVKAILAPDEEREAEEAVR